MRALLTAAILVIGFNAFAADQKTAPVAQPQAQPAAAAQPATAPAQTVTKAAEVKTEEKDCTKLTGKELAECKKGHTKKH